MKNPEANDDSDGIVAGDRVSHPRKGPGTVHEVTEADAYVEFDHTDAQTYVDCASLSVIPKLLDETTVEKRDTRPVYDGDGEPEGYTGEAIIDLAFDDGVEYNVDDTENGRIIVTYYRGAEP